MSKPSEPHSLRVRQIRYEATGIHSYELADPEGQPLPPFTAGAHIDVHLAGDLVRQYSLSNSPSQRDAYVIAVLKEDQGRGGSKAMHETVQVSQVLTVSGPRNHFELEPNARKVILLAGGIGITPLKSMAHALSEQGIDYELHYCARSRDRIAFEAELKALEPAGRVHFHFDGGNPLAGLNIAQLLREPEAGTHVYYCGPAGFMKACKQATAPWPAGNIHCEHFKAPGKSTDSSANPDDAPAQHGSFRAKLASTGRIFTVPAGQTLVEAMEEVGVTIDTSCSAGLCGTCTVSYLSGEVDHQDHFLSDDDHRKCLTPCVSRGKDGLLVLDL